MSSSDEMVVPGAHPDLPIVDESGASSGLEALLARLEAEARERVAQRERRDAIARDIAHYLAPAPSIWSPRRERERADVVTCREAREWLARHPTK